MNSSHDEAALRPADVSRVCAALRTQIATQIVGQERVVEELLLALFAGGHCLIQGVPGLAKTLLISTLASTLDLSLGRIQFTPDLMPSDITGTEILQEESSPPDGQGSSPGVRKRFEFAPGPIFANIVLADEINRAPPKTQAALLQAMQEKQVTIGRSTMNLPEPFFVLATQNPIEQEGTYPLPEAQLDRFMFMVLIDYPARAAELAVLQRTTGAAVAATQTVLTAATLMRIQSLVREVLVSDESFEYALNIVRSTRPAEADASDFVRHWLAWGAGPRAGQFLILAAKARALMAGRSHVMLEDIRLAAAAVLRHRLVLNFNARAEGVTIEQIIEKLLTLQPRVDETLL